MAGCENPPELTSDPMADVRWVDTMIDRPSCLNTTNVQATEDAHVCVWECHLWWTPLRGVQPYTVARTWNKQDNGVWVMTTDGTAPAQYSYPCGGMP